MIVECGDRNGDVVNDRGLTDVHLVFRCRCVPNSNVIC